MDKVEEFSYVLSDENNRAFYRGGHYYVDSVLQAERFPNKSDAIWTMKRRLNKFQADIFTKVLPVKITVEIVEEKEK